MGLSSYNKGSFCITPFQEIYNMKYGIVSPFGDARMAADLAAEAEKAGWDGFFVGEALWHNDAWVSLTAAAMRTGQIRLGSMLTPLPSINPRKLASETATLDNLSNGRVILSVGVGAVWMGYQGFPDEVTDVKTRAELLDEGIDILTLLYQGQPFDYNGKHHHIQLTLVEPQHYPPQPIQKPRIPLWVVGVWPRMKSMRRALRCDGILPAKMDASGKFVDLTPEDLAEIKAYIDANRTLTTPFDFVAEGLTRGLERDQAQEKVRAWADAGATWWVEPLFGLTPEQVLEHTRQGPPRFD
jgi:hypothetical protein